MFRRRKTRSHLIDGKIGQPGRQWGPEVNRNKAQLVVLYSSGRQFACLPACVFVKAIRVWQGSR